MVDIKFFMTWCEHGGSEKIQAHHAYSKPLEVEW